MSTIRESAFEALAEAEAAAEAARAAAEAERAARVHARALEFGERALAHLQAWFPDVRLDLHAAATDADAALIGEPRGSGGLHFLVTTRTWGESNGTTRQHLVVHLARPVPPRSVDRWVQAGKWAGITPRPLRQELGLWFKGTEFTNAADVGTYLRRLDRRDGLR